MKQLIIVMLSSILMLGCSDWAYRNPNTPTQSGDIKYHFDKAHLGMFCTVNDQCGSNCFCLKDTSYVGTCAQLLLPVQ